MRQFRLVAFVSLALFLASPVGAQVVDGADCPPEGGFFSSLLDTLSNIFRSAPPGPPPAPEQTGKEFAESIFPTIVDPTTDPYGYKGDTSDGCYARAYSICYDIHAGKLGSLPSGCKLQTVYVFWKNKNWRYHTACSISCPDGDFVFDGLNGKVVTAKEWFDTWQANDREETKTGVRFGPYDPDGTPTEEERQRAQDVIDEQNKKAGTP